MIQKKLHIYSKHAAMIDLSSYLMQSLKRYLPPLYSSYLK